MPLRDRRDDPGRTAKMQIDYRMVNIVPEGVGFPRRVWWGFRSGWLDLAAAVSVIPGRAKREPGIHNHDREYGFRACAKWRIPDVHLHIGE